MTTMLCKWHFDSHACFLMRDMPIKCCRDWLDSGRMLSVLDGSVCLLLCSSVAAATMPLTHFIVLRTNESYHNAGKGKKGKGIDLYNA